MKNISFVSPFSIDEKITGGQIYDSRFLSVIESKTQNKVKKVSLESDLSKKIPFLAPFFYLFRSLKDKESDIVVMNSSFYMRLMLLPPILRKLKRKKLMTIHHHFMYRQFKGIKRKFYKRFEWNFLKSMDNIVIASPYVYDELSRHINKGKLLFYQIPFQREILMEPAPIKGNLTFAGTIEERKGIIYLLQSLDLLKRKGYDYPLTIMGKIVDQQYYNQLIKYIHDHNLTVNFTGFVDKEGMAKILSETDVFTFPSLLEGYGMVLVEAQVYGLPIVSFDNSAMPYNVKNGETGFAVENRNVEAFAEAIQKIVEDRDLRQQLSIGALENLNHQNTEEQFQKDIVRDFSSL